MKHINSNSNCGTFGVKRPATTPLYFAVPTPNQIKLEAAKDRLDRVKTFASNAAAIVLLTITLGGSLFTLTSCSESGNHSAVAKEIVE
ncbi:hypothetical protein EC844_12568 [Acinetobacter calcoaceticus]|uniref:Uncharacterized protein n=1 Tax=Acinetobacter calcoaceticus TaxID=471 RepID=A0A4R1XJQ4_ACICA|nr:hypothetical protein EC844_12568 [Acinetobacter calcoaceticus]